MYIVGNSRVIDLIEQIHIMKKHKNMESMTPEEQTELMAQNTITFSRFCPQLGQVVVVEGGLKEWEEKVKTLLQII